MKRPVLHHVAVFCIAVCIFFSVASYAKADTFTFPQDYHYAGLTFSDPLTYTKPSSNLQTTTIRFTSRHTLRINRDDTMKPLEAIVLTPTITETPATVSANLLQPTPTIFEQPTMADSETQDQTISPTPTQEPTDPPIASYAPTPGSNAGGLNASDLFSMVNSHLYLNIYLDHSTDWLSTLAASLIDFQQLFGKFANTISFGKLAGQVARQLERGQK